MGWRLCALLLLCAAAGDASQQRFVNATGNTTYDVGVSIGKQQKATIEQMFHHRKAVYASRYSHGEWERYANASLPTIAKHAPITLEEMRGVADGAELPLQTLLMLRERF